MIPQDVMEVTAAEKSAVAEMCVDGKLQTELLAA
jgi:hypothetical protein